MLVKKLLIFLLFFTSLIYGNKQIGVYEHLGEKINLELLFTNEYKQEKSLKESFSNKATILTLNYFKCPGICSPQLYALASTLNKLDLKPYTDYKVITVSIETQDTPFDAMKKKESILKTIKKSFPPQTWSFLSTKNQKIIDELSDSLGYKYEKRMKDGVVDYLHPGVIMVISPKGKISRYLNGIDFLPFDLKLALLEANKENTGPTIAKALLYCFAYDAKSKTYVFQLEKIIGTIMLLLILIFFIYLIKTGRNNKKKKD